MQRQYFASLLALALFFPACGDTESSSSGTTTTSTGGQGGAGGGGGGEGGFSCASPSLTKGPWALAVDETHATIRWEACATGTPPDVRFKEEGGVVFAPSSPRSTTGFIGPIARSRRREEADCLIVLAVRLLTSSATIKCQRDVACRFGWPANGYANDDMYEHFLNEAA